MMIGPRSLPVSTQPYASPSSSGGSAGCKSSASQRLLLASAAQHTEGELNITTDEGDTVSLSFTKDLQISYAGLVRGPKGGDEGGPSRALKLDSSSQFSVQIVGDLSDQERADIEALVQKFVGAIGAFARGDMHGAADQLQAGNASDSLAGFTVEMSQESSVTVARVVRRMEPTPQPTPVQPAVDPENAAPAVPGVVAGGVQPQPIVEPISITPPSPSDSPANPAPPAPSEAQAFADRLLEAVRASTASFDRLGKLLGNAMQQVREHSGRHAERARMDDLIHAWRQRTDASAPAPDPSVCGAPATE